jgi:hypothetical protein
MTPFASVSKRDAIQLKREAGQGVIAISPVSGDPKNSFTLVAAREANIQREGLPDPAKVAGSGIKTKESLAWLEAEKSDHPSPELNTDDAKTRMIADEDAREEQQGRVNEMRRRFHGRARKGREDFRTARDYRGDGPER